MCSEARFRWGFSYVNKVWHTSCNHEKSLDTFLSLYGGDLYSRYVYGRFHGSQKVLTEVIFSYVNKVWHAYCKGYFDNDSHSHRVFDFDSHSQQDLVRTKTLRRVSHVCMRIMGSLRSKRRFNVRGTT